MTWPWRRSTGGSAASGLGRRLRWMLAGMTLIWLYARRTRGFDRIDPTLRSALLRLRTPSFGPILLRLARMADFATACAEGVTVETHSVTVKGVTTIVYLYRPESVKPSSPALLYTHGGGMIIGSARNYHAFVSAYARDLGIVVVSAEYRLAPEHPFPAALDDIHAAWRWLVTYAGKLGIDARRIAVAGESAGGGLTAALCLRLFDEGGQMPAFQLLSCPMLDDRTTLKSAPAGRGQIVWTEDSNRYAWSAYLGHLPVENWAHPYAAPARREDLKGLPPTWIGVGTLDLFYAEDLDYARRLRLAGTPCELEVVEGAYHGFDRRRRSPVAAAYGQRIRNALATGLAIDR